MNELEPHSGDENDGFPTTRWTLIFDLQGGPTRARQHALDELCRHYWLPIYAFVRSKGHQPGEAEDLTQGFFHKLLKQGTLSLADSARGKLRSFLLETLTNFMRDEWRKETSLKRGGDVNWIEFDAAEAERLLSEQESSVASPEKAFDRAWALTLISSVQELLAEEYASRNKGREFAVMRDFLSWNERQHSYAEACAELDTTEAALKQSVFRMRKRFGILLRRQLAYTTESETQVEEELQSLFAAFR